jgi:hypothetical protein
VFKIDSIEAKSTDPFAEIEFEDEEILLINLNSDQTRLIVLLNVIQDEDQNESQLINIYDLTTLAQNKVILVSNKWFI